MELSLLLSLWNEGINSVSLQDKERDLTFLSWMERLLSFDKKTHDSLNPEELKSIEEEKQMFLKEIGFDEKLLRNYHRVVVDNYDRIACQTTKEGIKHVIQEMDVFGKPPNSTLEVLHTALDKYILEKRNTITLTQADQLERRPSL